MCVHARRLIGAQLRNMIYAEATESVAVSGEVHAGCVDDGWIRDGSAQRLVQVDARVDLRPDGRRTVPVPANKHP